MHKNKYESRLLNEYTSKYKRKQTEIEVVSLPREVICVKQAARSVCTVLLRASISGLLTRTRALLSSCPHLHMICLSHVPLTQEPNKKNTGTLRLAKDQNQNTAEPGYNISICITSSITSDVLWCQSVPHC